MFLTLSNDCNKHLVFINIFLKKKKRKQHNITVVMFGLSSSLELGSLEFGGKSESSDTFYSIDSVAHGGLQALTVVTTFKSQLREQKSLRP